MLSMLPLLPPLLLLLLLLTSPADSSAGNASPGIAFTPPVMIGHHDFWPNGYMGFGDGRHAIGSAEGGHWCVAPVTVAA